MKPRLIASLFLALVLELPGVPARASEARVSLDSLIAEMHAVTQGKDAGVDQAEEALAKKIQGFGAEAVPRMIPLLKDPDSEIRRFAGYVLRDLDGVSERELDALIQAHQNGDGWIPPAIGRIGSPKAIAYLVEDIRRHPQTHTQVVWALVKAGSKAAVPLAEIFRSKEALNIETLLAVSQVLHEMEKNAEPAGSVLMDIANDHDVVVENRILAVRAIGAIGAPAAQFVPDLKRLAASDSEHFAKPVESAIVGIGSPEAAEVFIALLKARPDELVLRDLAEIRGNGSAAGPAVVALLKHENWSVRVAAARTLGYIGYNEATSVLRECLDDPNDWRMVFVASEALGMLKDKKSLNKLAEVSKHHWFPVVRKAAGKSIQVINGSTKYQSRWHRDNFAFEYFSYVNAGVDPEYAGEKTDGANLRPKFIQEEDALSKQDLMSRKYPIEIVGYDEKGRHATPRDETPGCGLRCGKGMLLGSNRGEWGGELVHMDEAGHTLMLVEKNTEGIHHMPFGIVAAVGLAHIFLNSGELYLIEFGQDGKPSAKLWKTLPGAPEKSGLLKNGNLFIECVGGSIEITPLGEFRMATKSQL